MRRIVVIGVIGVILALSAVSPRAASPAPSESQKSAYSQALKKGRKLAGGGNLKGAEAAFDGALAAIADDPAALNELSIVVMRRGDLPRVQALAERAERSSGDRAELKGAALYNLGFIKEQRGDRAGAVEAYARSLRARSNRTVRQHLARLDAGLTASLDPFAPRKMDGPFPSVAAWCERERFRLRAEHEPDPDLAGMHQLVFP